MIQYAYRLISIIWSLFMVFKDSTVQQSTFVLKKLDDGIPEDKYKDMFSSVKT